MSRALRFLRNLRPDASWEAFRTMLAVIGGGAVASILTTGQIFFILPGALMMLTVWYMLYRLY